MADSGRPTWRKYVDAHKAVGLCARCGKHQPVDGNTECQECAGRRTRDCNRRIKRLADAGLCTQCGKVPPREGKKRCQGCTDQQSQYAKDQREMRASYGMCSRCGIRPHQPGRVWCKECEDREAAPRKQYYLKYRANHREQVLNHYGWKCACPGCNETEPKFLTIDHVNNDGAKHRKKVPGEQLPKWLVDHNFPEGYQILCWNCNSGRAANGGVCPHLEKKGAEQCA